MKLNDSEFTNKILYGIKCCYRLGETAPEIIIMLLKNVYRKKYFAESMSFIWHDNLKKKTLVIELSLAENLHW